jgi:hypothetical protein
MRDGQSTCGLAPCGQGSNLGPRGERPAMSALGDKVTTLKARRTSGYDPEQTFASDSADGASPPEVTCTSRLRAARPAATRCSERTNSG